MTLRSRDRVRISVQLIDAGTDAHLWGETYQREIDDVLRLQSEVAVAIAREIRVKLTTDERGRLSRARTVDPKVYELYLKGRHFANLWTEEGFRKGIEFYEAAN